MANFSRGLGAESHLIAKLTLYGCDLAQNPTADHEHKLDFIVLNLPDSPRILSEPLGVQVTMLIGDLEKRTRFTKQVTKNPYTPRNIYIELASDLDLDKGGAFAVLVAITNFVSDTRFREQKIIAVQIRSDLTYEFQEILPAKMLPPKNVHPSKLPPNYLSGYVSYFDPMRHFGFIKSNDGKKYFFHVSNVRANFADYLSSMKGEYVAPEEGRIEIAFLDAGVTPRKKDPQARDVYRINIT